MELGSNMKIKLELKDETPLYIKPHLNREEEKTCTQRNEKWMFAWNPKKRFE